MFFKRWTRSVAPSLKITPQHSSGKVSWACWAISSNAFSESDNSILSFMTYDNYLLCAFNTGEQRITIALAEFSGFLTLHFAFPDEPSHDLIERSGDAQSLAIAPDRSVNRVYLGARPALQILKHRALVIVCGRDEVTIEQRAIVLHSIPQEFDPIGFGHDEGLVDEPIHNLPQFGYFAKHTVVNLKQRSQCIEGRVVEDLGPKVRKNLHCVLARDIGALESFDPVVNPFQHHAIRNLKGTDDNRRSLNGDCNPPGFRNDRADKNICAQTSLCAENSRQGFDVSKTVLQ